MDKQPAAPAAGEQTKREQSQYYGFEVLRKEWNSNDTARPAGVLSLGFTWQARRELVRFS